MFARQSKLIKEARLKKGLTQTQVATSLGYTSPQFLSNIERSLCSAPPEQFILISNILKIPLKDLRQTWIDDSIDRLDKMIGETKPKKKSTSKK